eukprot:TRINITY_DN27269_c0_g1_i1.p1 TRINITY_DN27269_c0_g1~~TRINITY_DN27269_c0_g1_i1.p1  ORF type:complete len:431 (+),score=58.60 TRINITY_DN27269_c0_g1_i1:37-1329(+)
MFTPVRRPPIARREADVTTIEESLSKLDMERERLMQSLQEAKSRQHARMVHEPRPPPPPQPQNPFIYNNNVAQQESSVAALRQAAAHSTVPTPAAPLPSKPLAMEPYQPQQLQQRPISFLHPQVIEQPHHPQQHDLNRKALISPNRKPKYSQAFAEDPVKASLGIDSTSRFVLKAGTAEETAAAAAAAARASRKVGELEKQLKEAQQEEVVMRNKLRSISPAAAVTEQRRPYAPVHSGPVTKIAGSEIGTKMPVSVAVPLPPSVKPPPNFVNFEQRPKTSPVRPVNHPMHEVQETLQYPPLYTSHADLPPGVAAALSEGALEPIKQRSQPQQQREASHAPPPTPNLIHAQPKKVPLHEGLLPPGDYTGMVSNQAIMPWETKAAVPSSPRTNTTWIPPRWKKEASPSPTKKLPPVRMPSTQQPYYNFSTVY